MYNVFPLLLYYNLKVLLFKADGDKRKLGLSAHVGYLNTAYIIVI